MSVVLAFSAAVLFGLGTFLLLQRRLSRLIVGLGLLAHGANILLLISAEERGRPVFPGSSEPFADPLPQALALTAIVISFGVTAFLLALAWRSVELTGDDLVEDDIEDRRIAAERAVPEDYQDDQVILQAQQDDEANVADDDEGTR
jgi:multicomponent Na+:H+ antiporter subunit C